MNRDVWKKRRSRRNFCIALYTAIYINCLLDGTKYIIFRPSFNKNFDVIRDFSFFFSFPGKREHYLSRAFRVVYSELISSAKWFNLIYPRCRSRGRAKSDPTVYPVYYVPERREQIQSDFRGRPEQAPPPLFPPYHTDNTCCSLAPARRQFPAKFHLLFSSSSELSRVKRNAQAKPCFC